VKAPNCGEDFDKYIHIYIFRQTGIWEYKPSPALCNYISICLSVSLVRYLSVRICHCRVQPAVDSGNNAMLNLLSDDILEKICVDLSGSDLLQLELVCKRLRHCIKACDDAWMTCLYKEYQGGYMASSNQVVINRFLMQRAAVYAGSWKSLYHLKKRDKEKTWPWLCPTNVELEAIIDCMIRDTAKSEWIHQDVARKAVKRSSQDTPQRLDQDGVDDTFVSSRELATTPVTPVMDMGSESVDMSILLLFDSSSSLATADFAFMKRFASMIVDAFKARVSCNIEMAIMQFSHVATLDIPLKNIKDPDYSDKIEVMRPQLGSTDLLAAVKLAQQVLMLDMDRHQRGASSVRRLAILFSDGHCSSEEHDEAERLIKEAYARDNTRFYCMGIGCDQNEKNMKAFAALGGPSGENRFFSLRKYCGFRSKR